MIKWIKNLLFPSYEEPQRVEIQPISERFPITDEYRIKKELEKMKAFLDEHSPRILEALIMNRKQGPLSSFDEKILVRDAVSLTEELRRQIDTRLKDEKEELERIFADAEKSKAMINDFSRNVGGYDK